MLVAFLTISFAQGQVDIEYDSGTQPHIEINETGAATDWTRIWMRNSADAVNYWSMASKPAAGQLVAGLNSPIGWYYNGTEKFSVSDDGFVRINSAYVLPNADGLAGQVLTTNGSGGLGWAAGGGGSSLWTESGANVYRASGKVGIGTVPVDDFHLKVAGGNCDLRLESPSGGNYVRYYEGSTSLGYLGHNGINLLLRNTNPGTDVYVQSEDDIQLWANGSTRLFVEETGDVGIGTTNPSQLLHLSTTGNNGIRIAGDDTGDARLWISNGSSNHFLFDDDSDGHTLKLQAADDFSISVNGGDQKFEIDGTTGQVDIYDELDVSGKVYAGNDIRVEGVDPNVEFWNPQGGAHVGADVKFDYNNTGNTGKLLIRNFDVSGSIEMRTSGSAGIAEQINFRMNDSNIFAYTDFGPWLHKTTDLGSNGKAWDDFYFDDAINQGAAAFLDRIVTEEIMNFPPVEKTEGMFDYMTERGDVELDPDFLPPSLSANNGILTDEMTTYNYKANYEQQQQINDLKEENAQLRAQIAEILELIKK